jgi:hypothetical protein
MMLQQQQPWMYLLYASSKHVGWAAATTAQPLLQLAMMQQPDWHAHLLPHQPHHTAAAAAHSEGRHNLHAGYTSRAAAAAAHRHQQAAQ